MRRNGVRRLRAIYWPPAEPSLASGMKPIGMIPALPEVPLRDGDRARQRIRTFPPCRAYPSRRSAQSAIEKCIERLDNGIRIVTRFLFQRSLPDERVDFRFS